jgi:hypothetical protein
MMPRGEVVGEYLIEGLNVGAMVAHPTGRLCCSATRQTHGLTRADAFAGRL